MAAVRAASVLEGAQRREPSEVAVRCQGGAEVPEDEHSEETEEPEHSSSEAVPEKYRGNGPSPAESAVAGEGLAARQSSGRHCSSAVTTRSNKDVHDAPSDGVNQEKQQSRSTDMRCQTEGPTSVGLGKGPARSSSQSFRRRTRAPGYIGVDVLASSLSSFQETQKQKAVGPMPVLPKPSLSKLRALGSKFMKKGISKSKAASAEAGVWLEDQWYTVAARSRRIVDPYEWRRVAKAATEKASVLKSEVVRRMSDPDAQRRADSEEEIPAAECMQQHDNGRRDLKTNELSPLVTRVADIDESSSVFHLGHDASLSVGGGWSLKGSTELEESVGGSAVEGKEDDGEFVDIPLVEDTAESWRMGCLCSWPRALLARAARLRPVAVGAVRGEAAARAWRRLRKACRGLLARRRRRGKRRH